MLYLARRLLLYTIYKFESQSGGESKSAAFILYPFDWKLHPHCHLSSWIKITSWFLFVRLSPLHTHTLPGLL